jgi:tRNA(adenine34) deaminase
MRAAVAEARQALATDDVPVGALVLDPAGDVLAGAHNRREADADPTGHAELLAIRAAAEALGRWRLDGCTLVVTLEPCTMCAGAIVLSRLDRLVFGAYDEKAGAVGSLWDVVRDRRLNHRPEVIGGVLPDQASALLLEFFARQR